MSHLKNPIKWHGGKHYLADWILSHAPSHTHYVEPFFGGGAVLLRKDPTGVSEVVNDLYRPLSMFWLALRDPGMFEELKRWCEATPFSELTWEAAENILAEPTPPEIQPLEIAWAFFVRCRMSRQGLMKSFATLSRTRTRRGMNEQASSWLTAIEGLDDVHERLKRVVVLNRDALSVIHSQDGPETLFYLDPPYLHETRSTVDSYTYEMGEREHWTLLEELSQIQGNFMLSGYPSEMYNEAAYVFDWRVVSREIDNKASSRGQKQTMTECLWMNY